MAALSNALVDPARAWRIFRARRSGVMIGPNCSMAAGVMLDRGPFAENPGTIELGPQAQLSAGVILQAWGGSIRCAENVFFGPYTVIYGHGGVTIGSDTLLSMHCCVVSSNHAIPPRSGRVRFEPDELLPVSIGADVWLGAGVKVMGGVTISDGCIVGAGAVVTRDLPAYSISYGVPARVVRQRE
jgi:acetyltransferase-like isoleucine patch superfamily enzyme